MSSPKGPHGSETMEVYNIVKCAGGVPPFISQVSTEVKSDSARHTHTYTLTETHAHCKCFIKLHLFPQMCLNKPKREVYR